MYRTRKVYIAVQGECHAQDRESVGYRKEKVASTRPGESKVQDRESARYRAGRVLYIGTRQRNC